MELPIQFPDYAEEIRREAAVFRALPERQRLDVMASLVNAGFSLLRRSPRRRELEAIIDANENLWRSRQSEAFARYGQPR